MTLLLDTHTLLWFLKGDPLLSRAALIVIEDPGNRKLVSIASCWEIAIKAGLGKMNFAEPSRVLLERELPNNSIDLLPVSLEHATEVENLPHHHRDPFDRLLVAQAILENIPIVSVDPALDAYPIRRIW